MRTNPSHQQIIGENRTVVSIEAEKASDEIQHHSQLKTNNKLKLKGTPITC